MLSKIVPASEQEPGCIRPYACMSSAEINLLVERKKRENERKQIIESNPDDPVRAARDEAHRIMREAQEKMKEAELEAVVLKGRIEKEVRERMGKEYQQKLGSEMEGVRRSFQETLVEMGKVREQMVTAMESDLLNLVFTITRKIMGEEVKTDPDVVLRMLRKGFEQLKDASRFEIHVHPDDYQWMMTQQGELKGIPLSSGSFKLIKDTSVEKGGCRIVSDSGEVSTEPSRQLEVIIKELSHAK
jgi:flagellar assembly protein FliH